MRVPIQLQGDCWPTRSQTWLLRAALYTGEPAWRAWSVWRHHCGDLADLDWGSQRLLPMLYRNLRVQRVNDPLMAPLKARYRQTWYRNQALFHQMANLLEGLHASGIDTLILKGAALSVLHYRDLAARPMGDFDILVPSTRAAQTFDELERLGWHTPRRAANSLHVTSVRQSLDFSNADGRHFDLHWYALWDCSFPGADDEFWAGAVPVKINRITTRALNPTDQLLHVCVHGASLNQVSPVRWAADAMQVLSTPGAAIDWPRLLGHARRLRLSLPLRDTLYYLQTALNAGIPETVIEALDAMPVTAQDQEFYRLKISRRGLLGEIPLMWRHYRLLADARHMPATRAGFFRYMRLNWGLVEGRNIPGFVVEKTIRRLKAVSRRSRLPDSDLGPNAQ